MNYLGIDIGGTKIALGLVSATGELLTQSRIPTNVPAGFDDVMTRLHAAIDTLLASRTATLAAIGIGSPGPFDRDGRILSVPTLSTWRGLSPLQAIRQRFNIPVTMENDADAALLGEAWIGAARDSSCAAMLTFGTGVGGAAILNGALLRGAGGEHPEFGHIPLDPAGPLCECGLRGCLEIIASGTALNAAATAAGFAHSRTLLSAVAADPAARRIVDYAAQTIARAAAMLVHALLPEVIVLGGGIMEEHFELFRPPIEKTLRGLTLFPHRPTRLARAQLGNDAGLFGAAYAAIRPQTKT